MWNALKEETKTHKNLLERTHYTISAMVLQVIFVAGANCVRLRVVCAYTL